MKVSSIQRVDKIGPCATRTHDQFLKRDSLANRRLAYKNSLLAAFPGGANAPKKPQIIFGSEVFTERVAVRWLGESARALPGFTVGGHTFKLAHAVVAEIVRRAAAQRLERLLQDGYRSAEPKPRSLTRWRLRRLATPPWADRSAIAATYRHAAELTRRTRIVHHVDHIVPLQGDGVTGLHVECNLRVIPARDNQRKGNRWTDGAAPSVADAHK